MVDLEHGSDGFTADRIHYRWVDVKRYSILAIENYYDSNNVEQYER
jgi:hypothetical protein